MRFTDVATARAAGWQTLIRYIGDARTQDPAAYQIMREALLGLNPTFSVNIRCAIEYSNIGSDSVTLTATGHSSRSGSYSMRQGQTRTLTFRLMEVFDLERIDMRARLTLAAEVGGVLGTLRGSIPWMFPWATSGTDLETGERGYNHAYHLSGSVSAG